MLLRLLVLCLGILCCCPQLQAQVQDSVSISVTDGTLHGTLVRPKGSPRPPLALILSDAGGLDRNGDAGIIANHCIGILSDSLVRRGIATLRFDKRGVGQSQNVTDERRIRFTDYILDAIAWAKWARDRNEFSRLIIVGHGEGALVASLAANDAGADGMVALCGSGEPADSLIIHQNQAQGLRAGALDTVRYLFGVLRRDGKIDQVPEGQLYLDMFRPTVQQYLYSWLQYDPQCPEAGPDRLRRT